MLFSRNEANYVISDDVIARMLADPASPIGLVCETIPDGAKVLDIGAGSGVLGRALAFHGRKVVIDGVEPNAFAAGLATPHYRRMHVGFFQDHQAELMGERYDFIVLADVIEHVSYPPEFLAAVTNLLDVKTRLLVSLPNVAFGAVRLALLRGAFDYTQSGLLEATHLRFFTRRTALRLFAECDLQVVRSHGMQRSWFRTEISRVSQAWSPATVLPLLFDRESLVYQYVFELHRPQDASSPIAADAFLPRGTSGWLTIADYCVGWLADALLRIRFLHRIASRIRSRP